MAKDLEYYLAQARRIAEHREANAEREIRKLYKTMLKDLKSFVAGAYEKHAEDDKLTFAMLQKAGYDARFLDEIEKRVMQASPKAARELRQLVNDAYKLAYDGMVDGVERVLAGADLDVEFGDALAITPEQIKNVVKNPLMEVALEKNHKDIIYDIKQAVAVGLMNGDRYATMARRISEKVDGAFYRSVRIARTEAHRVIEAGNYDAAVSVDKELQGTDTGLRMCKTWKTMKDERVRPQRRRRGKKGWSTKMGKGANHMKMEGQIVLADEDFDLQDGCKASAPGQSGEAGHDINCRCYASYELMTDAEYYAKTGKHFPGYKGTDTQEANDAELSRKQMRQRIKDDKARITEMKSNMRDVELEIAEHNRTVFDDLKGLKKSDISGRIQAIEERENEINPIVDRLYNRPDRGTPEYEAWREWKKGVDRDAIIEEQLRLASEKAALNSKLRRYERYEQWQKWKADHPLAELQAKKASIADEIKRLEKEIKDFEERLEANPVLVLADKLEDAGVISRTVKDHAKKMAESEIISALAGGDKTQGSCASVGLAYIGQKQGWNVLDFRDGTSRSIFANSSALHKLSLADGLKVHRAEGASSMTVGNRLLKKVEQGKEYYLCVGRHAAIVRKNPDGALQYLELQSARYYGWTDFNANPKYTLKSRFGCTQSSSSSAHYDFMIDLDESKFGDDFKELFSYLNTAENEQRKGVSGTIK